MPGEPLHGGAILLSGLANRSGVPLREGVVQSLDRLALGEEGVVEEACRFPILRGLKASPLRGSTTDFLEPLEGLDLRIVPMTGGGSSTDMV
jgi:hypothetical protein